MLGWIIGIAILLFVTAVELKFLWFAIRSLMNKNINPEPSERRWAKVKVVDVTDENVSVYYEPEPIAQFRGGIPAVNKFDVPKIESSEIVHYEYEGKVYKSNLRRDGLAGGSTLYCKKSDPNELWEYVPIPPQPLFKTVSTLFITAMMIFFEIAAISGFLSK